MKTKALFFVLTFCLGTLLTFDSCKKEENTNCADGTWLTQDACENAKDAGNYDNCKCEVENDIWFMVPKD